MSLFEKFQVKYALESKAVEILRTYYLNGKVGLDKEIKPRDFLIRINFSNVNSLRALKEVVSKLLEERYFFEKREILEIRENEFLGERAQEIIFKKNDKTKRPKAYMIDYGLILQVGRMKEHQGMTNEQIAQDIDPRHFRIDYEKAKPESKIRQISNYYKKYKELVNGAYKEITYP